MSASDGHAPGGTGAASYSAAGRDGLPLPVADTNMATARGGRRRRLVARSSRTVDASARPRNENQFDEKGSSPASDLRTVSVGGGRPSLCVVSARRWGRS